MLRFVFASAVVLGLASAASAESFTTRIETRPFYGSITTVEKGVRVIRPLPPERQVIINPNKTPLTLGYNDTRIYDNRTVYGESPASDGQVFSPLRRFYFDANGFFGPGSNAYGAYGRSRRRGSLFRFSPAY